MKEDLRVYKLFVNSRKTKIILKEKEFNQPTLLCNIQTVNNKALSKIKHLMQFNPVRNPILELDILKLEIS